MEKIGRVLQWLRWPNLIIVFLTLSIIRYGVLGPLFRLENIPFALSSTDFILLSLAVLMTTFGGYVINDIYDLETDQINKADRMAIGKLVQIGQAKAIYLLLNLLSISISLYLDFHLHSFLWTWLISGTILLLWWYSKRLKGTVLWGNILVSFLCGLVALLIPLAEAANIQVLKQSHSMWSLIAFYALFAACSNMLREIVKDAEDRDGDAATDKKTLAVVRGLASSKKWAVGMTIVVSLLLISFSLRMSFPQTQHIEFILCTWPFLILMLPSLSKDPNSINWTRLSKLTKALMLGGLIGLLLLTSV